MTNNDLTLLGILVDHSGSMQSCRWDMEGGLNTFIESQQKEPGQCEITLAEFDNSYDLIWPIQPIAQVGKYSLIPRGSTALLDGMGKLITSIGEDLRKRAESKRPGKVIIMVVTDGHENASREWNRDGVKKLVEQQQSHWNWEFIFLGANMDAISVGGGMGIRAASSMTYNTDSSVAMSNTYGAASANVSAYRSGMVQSTAFTEEDRANAMVDDKK